MIKIQPFIKPCAECNTCCHGHLTGEAYGHKFYPGKKCKFVNKQGCGIYEYRPKDPCVDWYCGYKSFHSFPEWARPDLCNIIFSWQTFDDILYLHGSDTGKPPVPEIFDWAKQWSVDNGQYMLIPREVIRKAKAPYKISIYGPDDIFKKLYAQKYDRIFID